MGLTLPGLQINHYHVEFRKKSSLLDHPLKPFYVGLGSPALETNNFCMESDKETIASGQRTQTIEYGPQPATLGSQ